MMSDNQDVVDLRKRVEVLERYVAIAMSSSQAFWSRDAGLLFNRGTNNEVTDMISGRSPWNPAALDKGG